MPIFDRRCLSCGWEKTDNLEKSGAVALACPSCGGATVREWTRPPAMIPDTFSTPLVDRVMDTETQVFHSRSEHRAAMRARGLMIRDEHVGMPGSDKSPQSKRWY